MTNHEYRLLVVCPVGAKLTAVVGWLVANVDATCPADLGPGLSPTGNAPATHRWQSAAWPDSECRQILARLCQLANVTPPSLATWNGWTRQQKLAWLATVRAAVYAGFGVYVTLADNTADWGQPDTVLATLGLERLLP